MREHIALSPLGFGCAPVMGKVSKSHALRAMAQAFDLGVTHFDVARSYGFGRAEGVLGSFIKGRRDKVTVTSKFGVVPPQLSFRAQALIPVARALTSLLPQLKAKLKTKSGQMLAQRDFSVGYARQCLDQSLTALATDYIDIYLVHEPDLELLGDPAELIEFLEASVNAGKIRRWGIAYQSVADYEWARALGGDVIQFEGHAENLEQSKVLLSDARQRIVTRPFGGGFTQKPAIEIALENSNLMAVLASHNITLADVALNIALKLAGESGSVLCSMFSAGHIEKNTKVFSRFDHDIQMNHIVETLLKNSSSIN